MSWGIVASEHAQEQSDGYLEIEPGTHECIITSVTDTKRDGTQYIDKKNRPFWLLSLEVVSNNSSNGRRHNELLYIGSGDDKMDQITMSKIANIATAAGVERVDGPDDLIDRMLVADFYKNKNGYLTAKYKPKYEKDIPQPPPAPEPVAASAPRSSLLKSARQQ